VVFPGFDYLDQPDGVPVRSSVRIGYELGFRPRIRLFPFPTVLGVCNKLVSVSQQEGGRNPHVIQTRIHHHDPTIAAYLRVGIRGQEYVSHIIQQSRLSVAGVRAIPCIKYISLV
jgi:hypothetical protein